MSRVSRERFTFKTPEHLIDAVKEICVETDRHYPILAEFHLENDGRYTLFSLTTVERSISRHYGELIGRTGWDVDWIKRDQQYAYHQSSGGGSLRSEISGIYWRHPSLLHLVREGTARYCNKAFRKRNKTRRIRRIPIDLHGYEDLMQMLDNWGTNSETYYCSVCREYLPDEGHCEHVWWCDEDAIWRGKGSTEGDTEPCGEDNCWPCSRKRAEQATP